MSRILFIGPPYNCWGVQVIGTWQIRILRRPAALVRFSIGEDEVTLMAMRAWDAPPRKYRRSAQWRPPSSMK